MGNLLKALNGTTKVWASIALVFILVASGAVFMVFQNIQAQDTYYVLNQDVTATTEIDPSMMMERTVSQGGAPDNALDLGDIQLGGVYATYNLTAGDILTPSNTGPMQELVEGVPEEYVVVSVEMDPQDSVAGYIQRGDYIDLIAVGESNSASGASSNSKYVVRNAIVVRVDAIGSDTAAATVNDPNTSASAASARIIGNVYTLAVPPTDAATIALVKDLDLMMVLSPRTYAKDGVTDSYIGVTPDQVFGIGNVGDSGYCTDPFFGDLTEQDVADAAANGEAIEAKPECELPDDIFGYAIDEDGNIIGTVNADGNIVESDGNLIVTSPDDVESEDSTAADENSVDEQADTQESQQ